LARLIYTDAALADLERLADFLRDSDPDLGIATFKLIKEAVAVLKNHPLIGRPAEHGLRELVISRGRTGYIALYSHEQQADTVLILALRHQREAGY